MRYAQIRKLDISNGEGVGVALFVQGCHFHCVDCFNQETWSFDGGEEWTDEIDKKCQCLLKRPYIMRFSVLGGEPLADENVEKVAKIANEIRISFPSKKIWLYTGYVWEDIFHGDLTYVEEGDMKPVRRKLLSMCDVVVDGRYVKELRDMNLKWRGSSNQRVIDVKKSIEENRVVLYCD